MTTNVSAQLATLVEAVHQLKDRSEEDRAALRVYHEKLGQELDADRKASDAYRASIREELVVLRGGQENILRRVEIIEPVASMVTSFRAKAAGAAIVLGLLGSFVIWMLTYFRDVLTKSLLP